MADGKGTCKEEFALGTPLEADARVSPMIRYRRFRTLPGWQCRLGATAPRGESPSESLPGPRPRRRRVGRPLLKRC